MSSTNTFDILVERMTTLNEMADSFKRTVKGVATGEDGLNLMLKAYRNEKTGKPVGAVSRVKNLIVLRALYDKDYINDEQFQALARKATSSNYIANTLKEINPTAHEKLFGSAQESEDIIKHIKLNAKDMLNFGLTNLKGKSFVEVQEDEPEDIDAKELEDEVTDEVISLAKGLTSADVEGTILDFDDVDVSLDGVENKDAITRKLIGILNNAGYTAETTGAGFNVEAPIGSFGSEEQVQDLMAGLILKHFPGVDENLIDIKLNTTVEDAEVMNEPLSDLAKVGVEEVYPDDQAELPDDYHEDGEHAEDHKTDLIAKIDQDVSNGVGRAELEGRYGKEAVAAYIKWGEENDMFEGEIEDAEEVVAERFENQQHLDVTPCTTGSYLTEQVNKDKRRKKPAVKSQSFRERYKPKTHWQLEELRRYGL